MFGSAALRHAAADSGTAAAMLVPAALQATPAAPDAAAPTGINELQNRIDSASPVIDGEKLHASLLRQFYQAHGYLPVWADHQAQATALLGAVMRAGEQGLDPDLFHAALLRNPAALSPLDRELLLSDAFLSYADALARGALQVETRMDDEDLKPDAVDIPAVLDKAIASPDPAAVITALAPTSPAYRALQQALADARRGVVEPEAATPAGRHARGGRAPAMTRTNEARIRELEINLERVRWLPRNLPADRVWVNTATTELTYFRGDQPAFHTRVIVGQVDKQTPELQTEITSLLYNPPWMVPRSILAKELGPRLTPEYMARHHMVWRHNGLLEQLPPSALGQVKFEMVDRFDVYLHDTPEKHLFAAADRRKSHGCVRVQNPRELAALLLDQPVDVINHGIALGYTNRRNLPAAVPVFIVYQTAFLASNVRIEYVPDSYHRDDEIWARLQPQHAAPVAEHVAPVPRRG